ncbi:hypothetical protein DACRYDRAFT_112559 [Dacryopinax primogenitus]|uniref:Uncharacterized protein n=1 Tax=Dacryopinax primogenitus (strain DJM 731) TaxID=1858805 RepID=M5FN06_DACPD|nr:uncharacterized protein DACRYDRAFT_112559 [Dacryopinax primogenitus]EJT96610.1 hypothetical protein DACRYDRAFT_112559 [Dacryopinax primogenitus]
MASCTIAPRRDPVRWRVLSMTPSFQDNIKSTGQLASGAAWAGTAPWCNGRCNSGELQVAVASEGSPDLIISTSPFGSDCLFGSKALCTTQYSSCTLSSTTLQIQCSSTAAGPGGFYSTYKLTGCSWVNPGPLCASSSTRAVAVRTTAFKTTPWDYSGPLLLDANVEVSCCA